MHAGRLVPALADWALSVADIFAVHPERANLSTKVSAFIDFLTERLGKEAAWVSERR